MTKENGALLVFDEVMTGFRVSYGGAQEYFGITPDVTTMGKVIGGGLPVGAYGGRKDIMQMVAPAGPMYQAGTLSGNPLAMTAGIETLKKLKEKGVYEELERKSKKLVDGIVAAAKKHDILFLETMLEVCLDGTLLMVPSEISRRLPSRMPKSSESGIA